MALATTRLHPVPHLTRQGPAVGRRAPTDRVLVSQGSGGGWKTSPNCDLSAGGGDVLVEGNRVIGVATQLGVNPSGAWCSPLALSWLADPSAQEPHGGPAASRGGTLAARLRELSFPSGPEDARRAARSPVGTFRSWKVQAGDSPETPGVLLHRERSMHRAVFLWIIHTNKRSPKSFREHSIDRDVHRRDPRCRTGYCPSIETRCIG